MGELMLASVEAAKAADASENPVLAAEMRAEVLPGLLWMAIVSLTCIGLWLLFRSTADPRWGADLWFAIFLLLMAMAAFLSRQFETVSPANQSDAARSRRRKKIQTSLVLLHIAAAPWMLMTGGPSTTQALGLAIIPLFLMNMQFGGIILRVRTNDYPMPLAIMFGVAASGALFAIVNKVPDAYGWAALLLATGVLLYLLQALVQRTILAELDRRVAVEAAAADTRQALAVAAAERDAKARFVASASHDLKQPLATAQLWARMGLDAPPGDERARAIDNAERAFASAIAQLDSMLQHLRLEAGAEMVRIRTVPLGPILQAAADAHGPAAQTAGLRISVAPTRLMVVADPVLLARALDNLIVNAIRHSGARRLVLGARTSGEAVSIWAVDDGRGIPAADRGRLFQDYAQGSDAGPGGFGIGLASVRRLLRLMGGDAGFEPGWTGGAAFLLSLPKAAPVPASAP